MVLMTSFAPFHLLVINLWSHYELQIGSFGIFVPLRFGPHSAFDDEPFHAVNIREPETLRSHMMHLRSRERAVTANHERWEIVHHL